MINGAPCRLLDIQELLSDTGIGRQQHVIVGQGQLDAVLNARPEDRRAIIEEAAGILKFRKRREKAQRRLEATEGNLLRLTDLLREVRRQLRPLERQADAARRHDGIVDELRSITLHLAGREIERLQTREQRRAEQRGELAREEQDVRVRLRTLDDDGVAAERALAVPGDDDVADLLARTEALRERSRGLTNLVAERRRGLERELAAVADEGVVETLVAEAARAREQLVAVDADAETLAPLRSRGRSGRSARGRAARRATSACCAGRAAVGRAAPRRRGRGGRRPPRDRARRRERRSDRARPRAGRDRARPTSTPQRAGIEPSEPRPTRSSARRPRCAPRSTRRPRSRRSSPTSRARCAPPKRRCERADTEWRNAMADASRWRARAETLALALDGTSPSATDASSSTG